MSVKDKDKDDSVVVTFRANKKSVNKAVRTLTEEPIVGVRSHHQLARKLFMDFTLGKLVYLNDSDRATDPALS